MLENIIVSILPTFLLFIIGPMEIYAGNVDEFGFLYTQFIFYFVGLFLAATLVMAGILKVLPEKISSKLKNLIFSTSIAIYLQNMFMNKYLFAADGSKMDWNSIKAYMIITSCIFMLVVIILFALSFFIKSFNIFQKYTCLFLEAVLFVAAVSLIISVSGKELPRDHFVLSGERQLSVAPNKNIIVLVLDRYTNEEFDEGNEKHPEFLELYKDFTYYNNAECCYAYTFPSLAHMLTGIDPDLNMEKLDWLQYIWHTDKANYFYDSLHEKNYTCNLYSSEEAYIVFGKLLNLNDKFDNLVEAVPRQNDKLLIALLAKMSIYKFVPYFAKPYFEIASSYAFKDVLVYDNGNGTVQYFNYDLHNALDEHGVTIDSGMENAFIVMHIDGIHNAYIDANGYYIDEENNNLDNTKIGLNKILNQYFTYLKELGVYDNSTIILMGDHGKSYQKASDPQPIFLIKQANEHHNEMITTSAPISFDDFQATILDVAGIDYKNSDVDYGTTIFDWHDGDERERSTRFISDGFIKYTYTGDRYTLIEMMKNGDYVQESSSKYW